MSDGERSTGRWERTWEIFHTLVEMPAAERAARLDELCGGDEPLRAELVELLAAHEEGPPLLDGPPPVVADSEDAEETALLGRGVLATGTVLADRFEIVRLLGIGGMGEVYEARDRELGERVAVKTLLPELASNEGALARFRREVQLARKVTHRNACRLFDLFQHGDTVFVTMEFLEGETLADALRRDGPLGLAAARRLAEQIAAGLEAAHAVGVVHRDLKPANVMLVEAPDGERAVVTDFGLATTLGDLDGGGDLTRTGEILGTPAYMAPEQLEGGETTPATDVYALGLLLFEAVCGERPFQGSTPFTVASRRLREAAPTPREHLPDLDPRWERTILRCLERRPEDRFQTPRAVIDALDSDAGTIDGPAPRRWLPAVAAVLALAAAGAGWLALREDSPAPPEAVERPSPDPGETAAPRTVLLARFPNDSGDPQLDGAVEAFLNRDLANSTTVTAVGQRRVRSALRLMRLPEETPLDPETAREVALRDGGISAVVTGAIDRIGERILLTADVIDPADGAVLASLSAEADADFETFPQAVTSLSHDLRVALGEPEVVGTTGAPRELVTTRSLRALRLYEEAEVIIARSGQDATSAELLRDAIRLDPEFASAHLLLGYAVYNDLRNANLAEKAPEPGVPPGAAARAAALPHMERAMQLADDVPDRERYFIRATYFNFSGEVERSIASYEALLRLHPDHYWGNNNLASLLGPARGVPHQVRKADYRPSDLDANWDAAHALAIVAGRPDEAEPYIERVVSLAAVEIPRWQHYEAVWARLWTFHRDWLAGDLDAAQAEVDAQAEALPRMTGPEREWTIRLLVPAYRALGQPAAALDLLPLPEFRLHRRSLAGVDALLSDDAATVADDLGGDGWTRRWWGSVTLQEPLRVAALAASGDLATADAVLDAYDGLRVTPTPDMAAPRPVQRTVMAASIAAGRGDDEAARAALEPLVTRDWEHFGATYFLTLTTLAEIHARAGRDDEALALLERAGAARERSFPFGMELWMDARLRLAAHLRRLGDVERAREIEAGLRRLAARAEPSFWLLRRLDAVATD